MTNKELILKLLDTDLDAEVDLKRTAGEIEFKPVIYSRWLRDGKQAVSCLVCESRVSIKAAANMNYCFNCGAKMRQI